MIALAQDQAVTHDRGTDHRIRCNGKATTPRQRQGPAKMTSIDRRLTFRAQRRLSRTGLQRNREVKVDHVSGLLADAQMNHG